MHQKKGLGWIRDRKSSKDFRFSVPKEERDKTSLPPSVVLWTPPILDQLQTNSCTGFATSSLYRYMLKFLGKADFQPSPLFNYWFGRHVPRLGWENEDEGAMPRDVMQSMISNGVVHENDWPFDVSKVNEKPPKEVLSRSKSNKVIEGRYVRMLADDNLFHLKNSLVKGLPFLVGIDVYSSFYDTKSDGMVPMPKLNETFEGGHLLYCTGFSDSLQRFRCPNSWGTEWGENGIAWIPYSYIANENIAGDFWRIEAIT